MLIFSLTLWEFSNMSFAITTEKFHELLYFGLKFVFFFCWRNNSIQLLLTVFNVKFCEVYFSESKGEEN